MPKFKRPRREREMSPIHAGAAAIDIRAPMHMAAVGANRDSQPVRSFGMFTTDLHHLADWFKLCGIKTVAVESTGVYWIPVFKILEQRGFVVVLINARDAKHVPGRKTDVTTPNGFNGSTSMDCCGPAFVRSARSQPCGTTCASGNVCWTMQRRTFNTCRKR